MPPARWRVVLASNCPRDRLSCRTTLARRFVYSALSATTATPTMAVTPTICLTRMLRRMDGSPLLRDRFLLGALAAPPELVELIVQRLQADAQDLGGAGLVVPRMFQRHQDQPRLGFFDGRTGRQ